MVQLAKFGQSVGKIDFRFLHMPGIKCAACGESWGAVSRSNILLTQKATEVIAKHSSSIPFGVFQLLLKNLCNLDGNEQWMSIRPATAVGPAKIKKLSRGKLTRIWSSGYGPFFCQRPLCDELASLLNNSAIAPASIAASSEIGEIALTYLDLKNFGAVEVCGVCHRSNYDALSETAIAETVEAESVHQFYALPGGVVVSQKTSELLQERFSSAEFAFTPWHLPN